MNVRVEPHGCMQSYEMNASVNASCQCHVRRVSLTLYIQIGRLFNDAFLTETVRRRMEAYDETERFRKNQS